MVKMGKRKEKRNIEAGRFSNRYPQVTLRLRDDELGWLDALCRRSKQGKSEIIRSLIMNGTVRERITKEHLSVIRQLIGESTNLNQLAKQVNTYGFLVVADKCENMAKEVSQLINRLKDDR
jgi:hypothetical protein